ncbi:hypothetical protein BDA96_05G090100 [Sorghum bicolor]|uniref:Polysaccharide biosynthesis domain-containing protein n=1 Tax=Sorghum bicolor TaxID=4558 RepID=A0A921QWK2_SORBI|nr:hypothetical protein BDA96_05G090100 [Sorghum bicolor]KAG0529338.1 hypothetical protein BDA96_05G090100 [Sorghum bicolor]
MTSPMHARKAKLKTHLISAKAKLKHNVTPRRVVLLAAAATSAFLLLFTLRTLHSAASRHGAAAGAPAIAAHHADDHQELEHQQQQQQQECAAAKQVPASVAEALVHYATSNETPPRQTEAEAGAAARVLARRAPCSLLVFGLGPGSALWAALNHGGRTLFLEADADRIASARAARPAGIDLQAHPVAFQQEAIATPSDDLLVALRNSSDCAAAASSSPPKPLTPDHLEQSPCALAPRGLPAAFYEAEWDVIVVDAPVPGAVYTAGVAARARRPGTGETDVLVHGVDGAADESFTRAFLCEGYLKEEAGRLRHFSIPSHRDKDAMPFCP